MAKKKLFDADSVKSIGAMAADCAVPERWLRNKVASGDVRSQRVGYNVFVPKSEAAKIKELAKLRRS
jgi:hypothetical protein